MKATQYSLKITILSLVILAPVLNAGYLGDNGFIGEAGYGYSFINIKSRE